jgi:hypothetical protein
MLEDSRSTASNPFIGRRERRRAGRAIPGLEEAVQAAVDAWDRVGQPAADQLASAIRQAVRGSHDLRVEAMSRRLDHIEQRPPERGLDQDFGIEL